MKLEPVTVTVTHLCPSTGKVIHSKQTANTRIAFCLDESDKKCLVVGLKERDQRDLHVAGGVRVFNKFVSQGKATLTIVRKNIQVMLCNADPVALGAWCASLTSGGPPPLAKSTLAPTASPSRPASSAPPFSKRPLGASSKAGGAANAVGPFSPAGPPARKLERVQAASNVSSPELSPSAMRLLTEEQQEVLREVVFRGRSVFFTGGAGVGKSFLLKQIVARLDPAKTYVTASTGIAACGVGGTTVQHFAGIGGFTTADRPIAELVAMAARKRGAQWRAAATLVIDEVSMLDGELFDLFELIARRVRGNEKPFGGLQLVLVGDFFQLPPVSKGGMMVKLAFEAEAWGRAVEATFTLTKVFRQSDPAFIGALNHIREGCAPPAVRSLLEGCLGKELSRADGIVATRIFTHKADCQRMNDAELQALTTPQITFAARDTSRDEAALGLLRSSCPAQAQITLKVGAQVILVKTLDAEAGLVNGARGVVTKFLATSNPSVRFDNGVERTIRTEAFGLSVGGQTVACRMQLPLALGWAISVHKSQGMTLDRAELALKNVFECGQMYVALSRVKSLEGLSLKGIDWSKLRAHPRVLAWHRQLKG